MFPGSFYVEEGGLASYGPDYYATGRQAARLTFAVRSGAPRIDDVFGRRLRYDGGC